MTIRELWAELAAIATDPDLYLHPREVRDG
jgi:hypothetical protein